MGVHTWFYKKIDISYNEIQKAVIKSINNEIEYAVNLINDAKDDEIDLLNSIGWYGIKEVKKLPQFILLRQRMLKIIESGYCKEAVINRFCNFGWNNPKGLISHDYVYVKNIGIFQDVDSEYHDLFRYHNDGIKLFSLNETINFINDENNNCLLYEDSFALINSFWNKYPDGLIYFA